MGMRGIRVGMMGMRGIRIGMRGIRVGMRGIWVGIQGIGGWNEGNQGENFCILINRKKNMLSINVFLVIVQMFRRSPP